MDVLGGAHVGECERRLPRARPVRPLPECRNHRTLPLTRSRAEAVTCTKAERASLAGLSRAYHEAAKRKVREEQ